MIVQNPLKLAYTAKKTCCSLEFANSTKEKLSKECKENDIELFMPELSLCTDNAAMIGSAAYFMLKEKKGLADLSLTAEATVAL